MVTDAHTPRQEKELAPSLTAVHPQVHHDSCTSISYRLLFYLRINNSDQYFVSDMCVRHRRTPNSSRGEEKPLVGTEATTRPGWPSHVYTIVLAFARLSDHSSHVLQL